MVKGDRTDYFGLSGYTAEELKKKGYMVWMPPQIKGSFLGEGDTPTFLNLIDNGLRAYENPLWGGWGGWMRSGRNRLFGCSDAPPPILPADTSGSGRGLAPAGSDANKAQPSERRIEIDLSNFHLPLYRRVPRRSLPASLRRPRTTLRHGCSGQ